MKEALISSQIYILKCTIAAVLSIVFANLLGIDDTLSASFVAILCVKPTFYTGLIVGKQQFVASFWGGAITGALMLLLGKGITVTAISLLIVISLCVYRKWTNYVAVAAFTVLYMFLIPHETIEGVMIRMASVFLGVATASLINLLLSFIRYKHFFYYRVKYASSTVFALFLETIEANKKADIKCLEKLYYDYENLYSQLTNFSGELSDISQELKIRKTAGGVSANDIDNIYRIIESLKMSVRYLQDIVFISKTLAPEHNKIPKEWKDKIDQFWDIEETRFNLILNKLIDKNINETEISGTYDIEFIYQIINKIKSETGDKKELYTKVMAIITDFQQLHFTINNFDYFVQEYNLSNSNL